MPRIRAGAVSLSAAVHAAIVGGFLFASVFAREPWPETSVAAAPRGPMILDLAQRHERLPRSRLVRPRTPSTAGRRDQPHLPGDFSRPTDTIARNIEPVSDPHDLPDETGLSGACLSGCAVGPVEPGPPDPGGLSGGGGGGEPRIVTAGPGGSVRAPTKIHDLTPVYPYLAIQARIQGRVEIECRIDTEGRVVDARVVSGHPLLAPAAVDAVRHWAYTPTLLNGVPVSVIMTVTVHFHLR